MNDDRVNLGQSGVRVRPLGIGTWAWGDRLYWGYGKGYGDADLAAAYAASRAAGVDFFDTAEVYGSGRSETLLGQFVRADGRGVAVATKFMPFPWRQGARSLLRALRASLTRLGLERVDLYQIHWPVPLVAGTALMAGLAEAVQAGLTRAVGVSNYSAAQLRRAHDALARHGVVLASNQVEYSLIQRAPERNGVAAACRELGIALIAYSPLGLGALSGKYTADNPPPGLRRRRFHRHYLARLQHLLGLLREIGQGHGGKTPSQVALNWVMARGAVPIPGAKNAAQAGENAGALGWSLAAAEVAALDAATGAMPAE